MKMVTGVAARKLTQTAYLEEKSYSIEPVKKYFQAKVFLNKK